MKFTIRSEDGTTRNERCFECGSDEWDAGKDKGLFVMKRGVVPAEGGVGAVRTAPGTSHSLRMRDVCKKEAPGGSTQ
jgi:hypothetical protein